LTELAIEATPFGERRRGVDSIELAVFNAVGRLSMSATVTTGEVNG
jgi:hypothetical protein